MAGAIASALYQGLFRRNAVFLSTIFASAFAFEIAYDTGSNKIWDTMNRGRQWKDVKHRYTVQEEEDDE
ncbi:UQCRX/QCR9 like ubiquinol-cytochrome C reductase family protein [Aspergillus avenaceus]|uniref:Complex III subunit 9 n=1 Tax=Aspergillus avenaceus TaxID=36643 RepID=A0A5N6TP30_ASPAV|nr:UQCRX/QCR9 like ubiquinol-cytochrome C reductase family protein [Aspergillus avenaceus]